jgi:diguanylate cyclase (GGDEF)-like protein
MSVRVASAVNTHATSERRLLHLATHDPLTGLPNRLATGQYLALSLEDLHETDAGIAVLYLDLDRFKAVNDTWGAAVGDQLLRDVADRLHQFVRSHDFVARIGGDEYIIVATDVPSESAAVEMGIRILESFRRPFALPSGEMTVSASLGVAFETGTRMVEAEDLLRMADTAMYRAKDLGGGTVARFDDSMRASVARRLQIEAALQRALELNEFTIVYQPIIDLQNERTVAFEALLRWNCGLLGSVSPVEFIPVAETTGLIRDIGAWVMRRSIAQLAEWRVAGADDLCLAVNLSACQLDDPDIIEVILGAARTYGVPTTALWVEITESVLVSDSPRAEAVLPMLRSAGVSIAADDFGTGYSSLSYLKRFPFDHVKIDRTFVNGLGANTDDEGIVAAVLGMAKALDLDTVAEGIETELQRDRLRALGCHLAQGYLFDRPLSVGDASARLEREGVTNSNR